MDNKLVEQFLHYILANRGLSQRTAVIYGDALRDLSRYSSSIDEQLSWTTLPTDIVRRWMAAEMERGCKPRTVRQHLAGVRTFYRYLLREGIVEVDPVHTIMPPKADKPLPAFLKRSEVEQLLDGLTYPDTYEGQRNRTIIAILAHTGIRAAELLGLSLRDIDLDEGTLKVTGKRNKQRIVPFTPSLAAVIRQFLPYRSEHLSGASEGIVATADDGHLLHTRRRTPLRYADLRTIVRNTLANVTTQQKRSPHVLRHTFATLMLDNGGDLEAIQHLLGHEKIATTEVYTHTTFAELREQYAAAHPHSKE